MGSVEEFLILIVSAQYKVSRQGMTWNGKPAIFSNHSRQRTSIWWTYSIYNHSASFYPFPLPSNSNSHTWTYFVLHQSQRWSTTPLAPHSMVVASLMSSTVRAALTDPLLGPELLRTLDETKKPHASDGSETVPSTPRLTPGHRGAVKLMMDMYGGYGWIWPIWPWLRIQ